jgi:hypothetical protein
MPEFISVQTTDPTRGLSIGEIALYAQSVVDGWEKYFREVLSPLSPDMLRVIATWCTMQADAVEPPPELGAPTFGWSKQKVVTRNLPQLAAANMARLLDAKGLDTPQICDEMARNSVPRGDGRFTWEPRAIVRLVDREQGRRYIWDVPRVEGEPS